MSSSQLFVVTVAMDAGGHRASLMALASVLHRRGIQVVEAELGRASLGRRIFSATFRADRQQAGTILKSFGNLVDVVDATLFEALDARGDQVEPRLPASITG